MIRGSRLAGVLWLIAAILAVAVTVAFRNDVYQWVVTIAAGVAAAIVGINLINRSSATIFTWSNVIGLGWLVVYAALIIQQRAELAAWGTDVLLGVLGLGAAVLAYRASGTSQHLTKT